MTAKATEAALSSVRAAARHPIVTAVLVLIAVAVLADGVVTGRVREEIAYLGVVMLSAVIIDVSVSLLEKQHSPLPVAEPRFEILVAAVLYLITLTFYVQRFWFGNRLPGLLRLAAFLCAIQIVLALFFLARKYSPQELGVRPHGFAPVPFVMAWCLTVAALVTPIKSTWAEGYRECGGSVWGWMQVGVFSAALPEEFLRVIWQTRVGALLKNGAAGWCVASLLWALVHVPLYAQGRSAPGTFLSVSEIVPYGLLLGYLTYRTQSILPSVLLHSTKFLWLGALG